MAEVKLEDAPPNVQIYCNKGISAMECGNFDYAMDMFEAALAIEPRLLYVRKLLRATAIKETKLNPPSKLTIAKGFKEVLKATVLIKKNPIQALEVSEKLLRVDPLNFKFSKIQCDAAEAAKFPEIAIQTLEILKDNTPPNTALLQPLAQLYFADNQVKREYECRAAITRLKPNDTGALKELKDAAARLTMEKSGWKKEESFHDVTREKRSPSDTIISELEQLRNSVEQHPQDLIIRQKLASLLLENKHYSEAILNLEKCQEFTPTLDPQVEQKLQQAKENQLESKLMESEKSDNSAQTSTLQKELKTMRSKHSSQQVERYPNDLQLKFDYGKLLFEDNEYTEAIRQFQLAQRNPQRRIKSLLYLARAFQEKGQVTIAREQLESALIDLNVMDEEKKEVLYELGLLYEETGELEKSKQHLKKIYAVDIGYRDIAKKIETQ